LKRSFLLKASTAHTAPDFDLRQVASTSGRLDVVCRCIQAAFTGPKGVRADVEFSAILEGPSKPPLELKLTSTQLDRLPTDEVEVAEWIFQAMQSEGNKITLKRESFERAVRGLRGPRRELFYLHEDGRDVEWLKEFDSGDLGFILGDHVGLDPASERFLDSLGIQRVSIGPRSYLSSSCILFVNSFLDSIEG
jgi:tRNA (pseudouridine54-N1)-methyltransferase